MKAIFCIASIFIVLFGFCGAASFPQATEYVAGFVLYAVVDGRIEYVMLEKVSELDDWSPPKGKMDQDEDAQMAAIRETFEETGFLETDYTPFFEKSIYFEYTTNTGDIKKVTLFPAKLTNLQKPVTIDPKEHAAYEWIGFAAGQYLIKPQYLKAFEDADAFVRVQEAL